MKRFFRIVFAASVILMISFSVVLGQDKKSEQKIKIIVNDGSGTRIVIDTVIYSNTKPDSIKLKDGEVICLKHPGDDRDDVISYSNSKEGKCGGKYKVMTMSSKVNSDKGETIYVNKGKAADKEIDKTFDVYVSDSDSESTVEKTRYVFAKDGMVVTVEGKDEAKTKELAMEIENKLGIKSEGTENNETIKSDSKKTIKK